MADTISYRSNIKITVDDFADLLRRSSLDERRPVEDTGRLQKMLDHANVMVTAWANERLVGLSRALTDFSFCCYLSDLAVDKQYQRSGIGKELIKLTHAAAGQEATLILMAAPAAVKYYPKVGMKPFADCFVIPPSTKLS